MKNMNEQVEVYKSKLSILMVSLKRGVLFYTIPGIVLGAGLGMRLFETGNVPGKFLKGASVYVTGLCQVNKKDRLPAFSLDQMTVTSVNDSTITGIITKTREYVECSKSSSTIDPLPYLKNVFQTPVAAPELTYAVREEPKKDLGTEIVDKEYKVTGICANGTTGSNETLADAVVVFKNVAQDTAGRVLMTGVITGASKIKGQQVVCDKMAISFSQHKETVVTEQTRIIEGEEDLRGKIVLVTSTCFPDERLEDKNKPKTEQVYYTFLDSPVKVISYKKDGSNRITHLTGISVEKRVAVVCDKTKYDIEVRSMTSDMRINSVNEAKK